MHRLRGVKPTRRDFPIFRDHLMISMLAAFPLRLRNFGGLTLGRTFVRRDDLWWIQIPATETKTKNNDIEGPLPRELVPYIDLYLLAYRLPLLQRRGTAVADEPLWLSWYGMRMSQGEIYHQISTRTLKGLGRRVNPHLFRDCVATSIAINDPAHVGIAMSVLRHRSLETLERHYNQARGIEANRLVQECLLSLRGRATRVPDSSDIG
jgi:integrase